MISDNGKNKNGNEWLLRFAATLLGLLAAAAITWNYTQLDTMKVEQAEDTILLKRLIDTNTAQEVRLQNIMSNSNAQEKTIQELSINQRNILKTLDEIHARVVSSWQ